jgi:hypothetical protein
MSFLNYVYTNNNFEIINQKYDTASDNDYQIIYNKVSLKQPSSDEKGDETYTYLSTNKVGSNDTTKIIGLKSNSQYVNLTSSDNNKRINDLINDENTIKGIKAGYFPIIINAYAQHKYHLNVNDTIQFKVNNKANRFTNEINGMNEDLTVPFKIVGVNTTYQGEEYFTNQELANYILGLRSRLTEQIPELPKTCNLHNYYINNEKQDSILELLNLEH